MSSITNVVAAAAPPSACGVCHSPVDPTDLAEVRGKRPGDPVWMCVVCRSTSCGHAVYGPSVVPTASLLVAIAQVANLLLGRLRRIETRLAAWDAVVLPPAPPPADPTPPPTNRGVG